jgi:hypothetical protein
MAEFRLKPERRVHLHPLREQIVYAIDRPA